MRPRITEAEFWSRGIPEPNTGCLLWMWSADEHGYGRLRYDAKFTKASRLAWIFVHGPIPDGLWVCHRCDTPLCFNPDHLFLGTPRENNWDARAKGRLINVGRNHREKTHCAHGHPYSGANVYYKRTGGRSCLTCRRLAKRKKHAPQSPDLEEK